MGRGKNRLMNIKRKNKSFQLELNDFFIAKKFLTVLHGKSGIGKSTSLNIISNYIKSKDNPYKNSDLIYMQPKNIFPNHIKVSTLLNEIFSKENIDKNNYYFDLLQIKSLSKKTINMLSGGEKRLLYIFLVLAGKHDIYLLDEPFKSLDSEYIGLVTTAIIEKSKTASVVVSVHEDNFNIPHNSYYLDNNTRVIINKNELREFSKKKKYNAKQYINRYNIILLSLMILVGFVLLTIINVSNNLEKINSDLEVSSALNLYNGDLSINSEAKKDTYTYNSMYNNLVTLDNNNEDIIFNLQIDQNFYLNGSLNNELYPYNNPTHLFSNLSVNENLEENEIKIPRFVFENLLFDYDKKLTETEIDNYDFKNNVLYIEYAYDSDFSFEYRVVGLSSNDNYVLKNDMNYLVNLFNEKVGFIPNVSYYLLVMKKFSTDSFIELNLPYAIKNLGVVGDYYNLEILNQESLSNKELKDLINKNVYAYTNKIEGKTNIYSVIDKSFFEDNFDVELKDNEVVIYKNYLNTDNSSTYAKKGDIVTIRDKNYKVSGVINSNIEGAFIYNKDLLEINSFGEQSNFSSIKVLLKDYNDASYFNDLDKLDKLNNTYNTSNSSQVLEQLATKNALLSEAKNSSNTLIIFSTVVVIILIILCLFSIILMYKYYVAYSLIKVSLIKNKILWIILNFIILVVFLGFFEMILSKLLPNTIYNSINGLNLIKNLSYVSGFYLVSFLVLLLSLIIYLPLNEKLFSKIRYL